MFEKRLNVVVGILFVFLLSFGLYNCGGGGGGGSSSHTSSNTNGSTSSSTTINGGGSNNNASASGSGSLTQITTRQQAKDVLADESIALVLGMEGLQYSAEVVTPFDSFVGNLASNRSLDNSYQNNMHLKIYNYLYAYANRIIRSRFLNDTFSEVRYKNKRATAKTTESCGYGGSYTIEGSYDEQAGKYNINYTFDNCSYDGEVYMNGSESISGTYTDTYADYEVKISNITISNGYSNITSNLNDIDIYVKGNTTDDLEKIDLTISMNGIMKLSGPVLPDESIEFNGFSINTVISDYGNNEKITLNGEINNSASEDGKSVDVKYNNYSVELKNIMNSDEEDDGMEMTINGIISFNYSPSDFCQEGNGTYKIVTDSPIRYTEYSADPISGRITINGTEVINYNSDGTVTVTLNGEDVYNGYAEDFVNYDGCYIGNLKSSYLK